MSKPNLPGALRAMHAGLAALHDGQMSLTMTPEQWGLLLAAADELERKPPPPLIVVAGMPLEIIQPATPNQAKMVEAIGQALAHRDCLPDAVATELENALKGDA